MAWKLESQYNSYAGKKIQRTESLADGVFAIAMTLLVLDIKVIASTSADTEGDMLLQLKEILPELMSYFMTFLTLGIFWVAHNTQYYFIEKGDRNLTWLSISFLMFISLLPFSTAFLSEHNEFKVSILVYWINILIAGIILLLHWTYAYNNNLLIPNIDDKESLNILMKRRTYVSQTFYFFAFLLCFIDNYLCMIVFIFIQLNYAFAPGFNLIRVKSKHSLKNENSNGSKK